MYLFIYRGIDFGELLAPEVRAKHKYTTYDLVANIVHDGEPGTEKGQYKVQILHKVSGHKLPKSLNHLFGFSL